jgi:hypothetical protein
VLVYEIGGHGDRLHEVKLLIHTDTDTLVWFDLSAQIRPRLQPYSGLTRFRRRLSVWVLVYEKGEHDDRRREVKFHITGSDTDTLV